MAPSRLSGLLPLVAGLRLAILTAVFASAALVVEYTRAGDPAFCGVQSGCFTVQRWAATSLATPVPLPHVGLFAYLGLFVLSLTLTPKTSRTLAALAGAGAATALVLLGVQAFIVRAYCVYCVTVDLAAIAAGILAILLARRLSREDDAPGLERVGLFSKAGGAWTLAAAAAVAMPFYWAERPEAPPVPPEVTAWQEPGKLKIVTFTDFECPFCRKLAPLLGELKAREGARVVYERKMVPLPFHKGAVPAALAYLCAPEDKRDAMAERLYAAKPEELEIDRVHELGEEVGVDEKSLEACVRSDPPRKAIERDRALFEAVGGRGLPLTYVGTTAVSGFQPDKIRAAAFRASAPPRLALRVSWMIAAFSGFGLLASLLTLRTRLPPPELREREGEGERGDEGDREAPSPPRPPKSPSRKKKRRR